MKAPARAVEKALTCYAGDVSRVVDVCRCRVLFASAAGALRCVELVRAAGGVRVVRVKNSMDVRSDAWPTAGFRGIVLNLLFDSEVTRRLGVENHVCELQLVLRSFAAIADNLSHARFLRFRAVRDHAWILRWLQTRSSSRLIWPAPMEWRDVDSLSKLEVVVRRVSESAMEVTQQPVCQIDTYVTSFEGPKVVMDLNAVEPESNSVEKSQLKAAWQGDNFEASDAERNDLNVSTQVFVLSALNPGGVLDQKVALVANAVEQSSLGTIWFTSTPLAAAASKFVFQIAFLGFIVFFLFRTVSFYQNFQRNGVFEANTVQLDVLSSSITGKGLVKDEFVGFGLVLNGCDVDGGLFSLIDDGDALCHYNKTINANGYYFTTSDSSEQDTSVPVRWVVNARTVMNSSWIQVAASGWQFGSLGEIIPLPQLAYELPIIRGKKNVIDNRHVWPAMISAAAGGIEWAIGLSCCIIFARLGWFSLVRVCFVCCASFDVVVVFVSIIGHHSLGFNRAAAESWLILCSQLTFAAGIYWYEAQMVYVFIVYGLQFWLMTAIKDLVLYQRTWTATVLDLFPSVGTATFSFGLCILMFRRKALRRARKLVLSDMNRYNTAWASVQDAKGAPEMLSELEKVVSSVSHVKGCEAPRQFNCVKEHLCEPKEVRPPGTVSFDKTPLECTCSCCPVKSLDQLFVQALCIHPILLLKAKAWATKSNGCFPAVVNETCTQKEFVTLDTVESNSKISMKFAKIKSVSRALEKLGRSYGQDVSQLVDVCRQSIVFKKIDDLVSCLRSLIEDKEVIILRIKNRLDRGYEASCSAGYRDVGLNLRIDSAETSELGVQTHVCEVQLILLPFADIKSDEGHKRYVTFRNLRGE